MTVLAAIDDDLGDALAQIAEALQVPVLLLALLVLAACAVELGRFAGEAWQRARHGRQALRAAAIAAVRRPHEALTLSEVAATPFAATALCELAALAGRDPDAIEYALADYELAAERRLDRTRMLVRAGPAVGLMGTLIPLAPGLTALGKGDVASLASDLRTAFAATVVGLLAGTVAFALTLTRTRMYSEDLAALERAGQLARRTGMSPPPSATAAPSSATATPSSTDTETAGSTP
jgi:biopolymer transport protein ExbB/TolQ